MCNTSGCITADCMPGTCLDFNISEMIWMVGKDLSLVSKIWAKIY